MIVLKIKNIFSTHTCYLAWWHADNKKKSYDTNKRQQRQTSCKYQLLRWSQCTRKD